MKRSVFILLLVATIDRIILQGIYPVLPVMVAELGVTKKGTGLFMTVTYMAIAAGSMLTPALLKRYSSVNKLSIGIALLTAAALYMMGRATGYGWLLAATCSYWCLSGIQINIYSVVMSYTSRQERIGANYGLLASTTLVGAVAGSFLIGPMIHEWGAGASFICFGAVTVAARCLLLTADHDVVYARHKHIGGFKPGQRLWLLLLSFNAGIMLSFMGRFNLSLIMKEYHYSLRDISYIFAWGSLIVLPLPYIFGRLSQRMPGKPLLVLTLACATVAMLLLYTGGGYGSFLTVSFLICIMTYCSRGVSQKLVYDMYPLKQQAQAQSMLTSANWVAGILGFLLVSVAADALSLQQVSLMGFGAGVVSIIVLLGTRV